MPKIVLVFIVYFFTYFGFAQTDSVIGKWKVVVVNNGELFYNAETDSLFISSEELKDIYNEESKIEILKGLVKQMYISNKFEFNVNGLFRCEMYMANILEAKYENDAKQNLIRIKDKNSLGETVIETLSYKFINGQLYLTLNFTDPPGLFILEKIE